MKTFKNGQDKRRPKQLYSSQVFRNTMNQCIMDMLESLNTARSMALAISFRNSGYKAVCSSLLKELHPDCFNDAHSIQYHKQAIALFKKSTYLRYEGDAVSESITNFFEVDMNCLLSDNQVLSANHATREILAIAADLIKSVIGISPKFADIYEQLAYTSGSVSGTIKSDVNIVTKLEKFCQLPLSRGAKPFFSFISEDPLVSGIYQSTTDRDYCELFTVAKQFNKVRVAAKAQMGNMLLQRPVGVFVAKRLRQRLQIDLSTQQDFHGFLVHEFHDVIATIDQSDASDRICVELIRALLPYDWFRFLNCIRHRHIKHDDHVLPLHKFANQGNGFIFELQTLVYYALAKATVSYHFGKKKADKMILTVFGDDLICDAIYAPHVCNILETLGQKINSDKSFISGRFKESCGVDTFDGINVRPNYIKQFSKGLRGYYELCNYINRFYKNCFSFDSNDMLNVRAYNRCLFAMEDKHKSFGPSTIGDAVIHIQWTSIPIYREKFAKANYGYHKRGVYYTRALSNTTRRLSEEWIRKPTYTCNEGLDSNDIFVEQKHLAYAAIIYALLGCDSDGTTSSGAPPYYVFTKTVTHWMGDN